jgi:drug/metabolite transporter (DMT)-like permease
MNTKQNWKLGLTLSLITVFCWATLPVALEIGINAIDAWTFTWFRFLVAALFTILIVLYSGSWNAFKQLSLNNWLWLLLAGIMLIANYILFIIGLEKTSPGNAQVLIQLAPLLMTIGGVLIYKESFNRPQQLGLVLLIIGLILFFNEQLGLMFKSEYKTGVIVIVFAAITWAAYALIQKKLLSVLTPQAILAIIYLLASLVLLPFSTPDHLSQLTSDQWMAVSYAAINTVAAYGAFAQALKYWQASRVGMVLAITPVLSFLFINLMSQLFPTLIQPERIQAIGWLGVVLIVSGSMFSSLRKK